jgi:photosystem II stability/assembly factor-like uncharacterized protein
MTRWLPLVPLLALAPVAALPRDEKPPEGKPPAWRAPGALAALSPRSIGPGHTSGRIASIAVDPRRRARILVGAASGGVWATDNAGITWKPLFDSQGSYSIGCVSLDPHAPDTIWVGTGESNAQRSVGYGDGVYRSLDGGRSWERRGLKASEHIGKIQVHPRDSRVVYVAAQGPLWASGGDRGLYRTIDGGETWRRILDISPDTGVTDFLLFPGDPDVLLAAAHQRRRHVWTLVNGGPESALYRSADGGKTWKKVTSGLPSGDLGRIGLAAAPSDPRIVYATVEASGGKGGVFRSDDGGLNWERRNGMDDIAMYYSHLVVDPRDSSRLHVMNVRTQTSTDGGKTFAPLPHQHVHVDNHCLWIDPRDTRYMLLGNDGGLYESHDGGDSWRHFGNLPLTQFYDITVGGKGPFYSVYGGTQDNNTVGGPARTRNAHGIENADWFIVHPGDGFQCKVDPEEPHIVYAEAQYGDLVRFDRRTGQAVGIQPQPLPGEKPYRWNWDSPLVLSRAGRKRLYFGAQRVFRSDDRGDSWRAISPDLSRGLNRDELPVLGKRWGVDAVARHQFTSHYGNLTALAESPLDENLLYAGSDDGLVHRTDDGGKEWKKLTIKGMPEQSYVARLVPSRHAEGRVFAVVNHFKSGDFAPYLFRSEDRGATWKPLSAGLPTGPLWAFAECPRSADLLFVGAEHGLHVSLDGGMSWQPLKSGLPTIPVRDLVIHEEMGDLAVGTFGRGIYILDDYAYLGELAAMTQAANRLFTPRKAHLYLPARPLGGGGKGVRGASFWTADNPPFGASLVYFLAEGLKTRKQRRHEAEAKGKVGTPTPEELRAEAEEEPPSAVLEVRDARGRVVRRVTGPATAGAHRVAWDLRTGDGVLIAPGKFTVRLVLRHEGKDTPVEGEVPLEVVAVDELPPQAPRVAFDERTARAQEKLDGLLKQSAAMEAKIADAYRKLDRSPDDTAKPRAALQAQRERLRASMRELRGDAALAGRPLLLPASVSEKLGAIRYGRRATLDPPTATHRRLLEEAEATLDAEAKRLRALEAEVGGL